MLKNIIILWHKFRLWSMNHDIDYLMDQYTYWMVRVSMCKLGLEFNADEAVMKRNKYKREFDRMVDKRNKYADQHGLRRHPSAD